jgi:hypothetical protein
LENKLKIGWAAALIVMMITSFVNLHFYLFPHWWHAFFLAILLGGWGYLESE